MENRNKEKKDRNKDETYGERRQLESQFICKTSISLREKMTGKLKTEN